MAVRLTRLPLALDAVAGGVERQVGHPCHGRAQRRGAPAEGPEPGQQLFEIEGLDEVIVSPGIEAGYAVVHGVAGGQNENGPAVTAGAGFAAHGIAVFAGQHQVEDDEVVGVDGGQVDRLLAIAGDIHGVSLLAQTAGDEARYPFFVFHQKYAHAFPIVRPGA